MIRPGRSPFVGSVVGMSNDALMQRLSQAPARTAEGEARFESMLGEFAPIYRQFKALGNRQRPTAARTRQLSAIDIDKVRQALRDAFPTVTESQASMATEALRNAFRDAFKDRRR